MPSLHPHFKVYGFIHSAILWSVAAFILLTAACLGGEQAPAYSKPDERVAASPEVTNQSARVVPKQEDARKSNPENQAQADAARLSALADQLRDELKKMNVNVLSLDVIQKTEEIEKLAKKIKSEGHGP